MSNGEDTALNWLIRVQDHQFDDWDRLSEWMSLDPSHGDEFNRLALLDQAIGKSIEQRQPDQPAGLQGSPWPVLGRRPIVWALAASIVAGVVTSAVWIDHLPAQSRTLPPLDVQTAAGETRTLTLPEGTRIAVAGGTSLSIDRTYRSATMLRGLATFNVKHDPDHPFQLALPSAVITDVGTRFDVRYRGDAATITVAEGAVRIAGPGILTKVSAGERLRLSSSLQPTLEPVPATVGGEWQRGVLEYRDATVGEIASDIRELTGLPVRASPAVADHRFAGVISIAAGDRGDALKSLTPLLDVSIERDRTGWTLVPRRDAGGR